MARGQTPSQTVGPFFAYGLVPEQYGYEYDGVAGAALVDETTEGERIRIIGKVFDGEGTPIDDALIEVWQANADGIYRHPADPRGGNLPAGTFTGFGRVGTGTRSDHSFVIDTIKPGSVGEGMAPHLNLIILMRGLLLHAYTRAYFSDEDEANAADEVLTSVPDDRRHTLIARLDPSLPGRTYRFDIHMQGDEETVFFDA